MNNKAKTTLNIESLKVINYALTLYSNSLINSGLYETQILCNAKTIINNFKANLEKRQTKATFLSLVQTDAESIISAKINEILSLKGITPNQIKEGKVKNPFPIGSRNLINLLNGQAISTKLQIKLLDFFSIKWEIKIFD